MTADDVLDAVAAQIDALDYAIGTSGTVTVVKRKLPVKAASIDQLIPEQLIVCPSEAPGPHRAYAFKRIEQTHLIDVVLVAPNRNNQVVNLPEYTALFQTLLVLFNKPRPSPDWTLPTRSIRSRPKDLFDRKVIEALGLDVLSIEVAVTAVTRVVA